MDSDDNYSSFGSFLLLDVYLVYFLKLLGMGIIIGKKSLNYIIGFYDKLYQSRHFFASPFLRCF